MASSNSFPKWYRDSPDGKKAVNEVEAERLAVRSELVAEIRRQEVQRDEQVPLAQARVDEAYAAAIKTADSHRESIQRLADADTERRLASTGPDRRISSLQGELRASASPLIDSFISQLHDEFEHRRRNWSQFVQTVEYGTPGKGLTARRPIASNWPDLEARLAAITDAIRAAEELKVEAGENLADRLEELRASLPPIRPAEDHIPSKRNQKITRLQSKELVQ